MKKGILDLRLLAIVFLVIMAGLTWWRSMDQEIKQAETIQLPVKVINPIKMDIEKTIELNAYIASDQRFPLFSQSPGTIEKILVVEGQQVKKDQLLIVMDQSAIRIQRDQAKAAYEYAQSEFNRISILHKKNLVSEQDYNKAVNGLDNAKSQYSITQILFENTEVRSPFDGVILDIPVKEQQLAGAQTMLIDISSTGNPIIEVGVPENLYPYFIENSPGIRVSHKSLEGTAVYSASLQNISPVVDPRTGTFKVTSTVDSIVNNLSSINTNKSALIPGMFVKVHLILEAHENVPAIPITSQDSKNRLWIYNPDEMTVKLAESASTGFTNSEYIELKSSFQDAFFVIEGQHLLKEGMEVRLLQ